MAYFYDSSDSVAGTVLVVPDPEDTSMMNLGGDIVITLSGVQDKYIVIDLWNLSMGASIVTTTDDNEVVDIIDLPEGDQEVDVDVIGIRKITISFSEFGGISRLRTCRNPEKTPAPQGFAPPSGGSFTREPTDFPTSGPTMGPTYTPLPECPKDLTLNFLEEGGTPFEHTPLEILAQNATSVTLSLLEPFTDVKEYVYVEYFDGWEWACLGYEEYEGIAKATFTARCMAHHPVTIVNVYVQDDANIKGDSEIPLCCHGPDVDYPVVKYSFKVYCVTKCLPEEFTEQDY